MNELHSFIGVKIAELPYSLENHYSLYFDDRSIVIALAAGQELPAHSHQGYTPEIERLKPDTPSPDPEPTPQPAPRPATPAPVSTPPAATTTPQYDPLKTELQAEIYRLTSELNNFLYQTGQFVIRRSDFFSKYGCDYYLYDDTANNAVLADTWSSKFGDIELEAEVISFRVAESPYTWADFDRAEFDRLWEEMVPEGFSLMSDMADLINEQCA